MKPIPAIITHVSSKGVQVTGHRLEKPDIKDFKTPVGYSYKLQEYESSKFTAWVENVVKILTSGEWIQYIKLSNDYYIAELNQSCQIVETGDGKCKIVKLNTLIK